MRWCISFLPASRNCINHFFTFQRSLDSTTELHFQTFCFFLKFYYFNSLLISKSLYSLSKNISCLNWTVKIILNHLFSHLSLLQTLFMLPIIPILLLQLDRSVTKMFCYFLVCLKLQKHTIKKNVHMTWGWTFCKTCLFWKRWRALMLKLRLEATNYAVLLSTWFFPRPNFHQTPFHKILFANCSRTNGKIPS